MDVTSAIFILQFMVFLAIVVLEIYNVFSFGQLIDTVKSIMLFIVGSIAFGLGLITSIHGYYNTIFQSLFNLEVLLFYIHVFALIITLLINLAMYVINKRNTPYYANQQKTQI